MVFKKPHQTKDDFIAKVLEIDESVFDKDFQGTDSSIRERYEANKESCIFVCHNFEIVGYICFFPITKELRRACF
jgi:hypothetical protein